MNENDKLSEMVDQPNSGESDMEVTENEDGSATITPKEPPEGSSEFYRNLAPELDAQDLNKIGVCLVELIEKDKEARKRRDEQIEEGMKRMGLDKETVGGANFTGASNVTHPMYTKACIDFEARAIKELFPPGGPVRQYIPGTVTPEKADRARRKAIWLNYQLTRGMPCFRAELEQVLINLPMGGNEYQKLIPPSYKMKVTHEWIPVDKMILPYAATNFYSAERRTHVQEITAQEFDSRVRIGMYRDISVGSTMNPEMTGSEEVAANVEGKENDASNPDGLRTVYECDCLFEIRDPQVPGSRTAGDGSEAEEDEAGPKPYLISIDESSRGILSIYRNWTEKDEDAERLEWTVEWTFIPFRGAYALGLPHIIGGLSIAATGALRALLDKAHIANFPGMVKMKGAVGTGQSVRIGPTEITELENSGEVDDIRKLIMPIPFDEPSPVLLTLLGLLGDQAEQVIRTTIDEAEAHGDVPVGTTLARIEQGMVAFSAIHGRLHNSMDRLLKILHRINKTYLEDKFVVEAMNEQIVTTKDFQSDEDVLPVSDPNIFCEVQRYGQIQTVAQRAILLPQIYDLRKVEELILKQMKLPNDGKDLLIPKPEPSQLNPVNENVALALGRPIVAFPQQDHEAHISSHCDFFEDPFFQIIIGSNLGAISGLLQNLKEHCVFWYATKVHTMASQAATETAQQLDPSAEKVDIGDLPQSDEKDPEISQMYDRMLAATSGHVMQAAQASPVLQRAVKSMQQLQQMLKDMQPPPVMDPTQAAMADISRQKDKDQTDAQLKSKELDQHADENKATQQMKLVVASQHESAEDKRHQEANLTKQQTNTEDNETALTIASMDIAAGKHDKTPPGETPPKKSSPSSKK